MIPVFNCYTFIEEVLHSVLQQDPGAHLMQIEVVDDASTDGDVEALVQRFGKGRVGYFRQPANVGSLRNFETCLNRSGGHLIHLLHGDDRVKWGFYRKMGHLMEANPQAGAACCGWNTIDAQGRLLTRSEIEASCDGIVEDWLQRVVEYTPAQYACMVVRRSVYEKLGGFYGVIYGEDREMWARIAREFPTAYTPDLLADYRMHSSSISGLALLKGDNIRDIQQVIHQSATYLPEAMRAATIRRALTNYYFWSWAQTKKNWYSSRDRPTVRKQMKAIRVIAPNGWQRFKIGKMYALMQAYRFREWARKVFS